MSSNKGTSSNSGGGSYGGDRYDSSDQRSEATKSVGKVVVNTAVQKEKNKGNMMYGGAASTATNEFLVSIGEATKGSQNPDGSFNYMLTSKGYEMKYGQKPGGAAPAMGTGNPAGILTSTKISKEMFESQQKFQLGLAALTGIMGVPLVPTTLANSALGTSYTDYVQRREGGFYNKAGVVGKFLPSNNQNQQTQNQRQDEMSNTQMVNEDKKKKIAGLGASTTTQGRTFFA